MHGRLAGAPRRPRALRRASRRVPGRALPLARRPRPLPDDARGLASTTDGVVMAASAPRAADLGRAVPPRVDRHRDGRELLANFRDLSAPGRRSPRRSRGAAPARRPAPAGHAACDLRPRRARRDPDDGRPERDRVRPRRRRTPCWLDRALGVGGGGRRFSFMGAAAARSPEVASTTSTRGRDRRARRRGGSGASGLFDCLERALRRAAAPPPAALPFDFASAGSATSATS